MLHALDLLPFLRTWGMRLLSSCSLLHIQAVIVTADICHLIIGFWSHPRIVAIQQPLRENQNESDTKSQFGVVWSANAAWERGETQMRGSSWWMTYNFTNEEQLCVAPSLLNHVSAHKHVCWEALVSPLMAAKHYSGLFMSSDVVSRWNHKENATLLDSKITLYFSVFDSWLAVLVYTLKDCLCTRLCASYIDG